MKQESTIIFVCEHGAAKSIIAAAYYNKLASEKKLNTRAMARGTYPDSELSPGAITGLEQDGILPTESVPQKLSPAEIESAQHIVAFCELPPEFKNKTTVDTWDDIPPVSDNYKTARDAILEKIQLLFP